MWEAAPGLVHAQESTAGPGHAEESCTRPGYTGGTCFSLARLREAAKGSHTEESHLLVCDTHGGKFPPSTFLIGTPRLASLLPVGLVRLLSWQLPLGPAQSLGYAITKPSVSLGCLATTTLPVWLLGYSFSATGQRTLTQGCYH